MKVGSETVNLQRMDVTAKKIVRAIKIYMKSILQVKGMIDRAVTPFQDQKRI